MDDVKTDMQYQCWDKQQGHLIYCCCGIRRIDSAILTTGIYMERENLSLRWQEKTSSGDTARGKVSMRGTGAETSVVAKKLL